MMKESTLGSILLIGWAAVGAAEVPEVWTEPFPAGPENPELIFSSAFAKVEPYVAHWTRAAEAGECDFSKGVRLIDSFGLTGNLETVRADLDRFFAETGIKAGGGSQVTLVRAPVEDRESYRLDVTEKGVTLTAGDEDGIRRGAYYLENRLLASPAPALKVGSTVRRSWMKTRLSRGCFAPVNRFPRYTDELMNDVDYYPEALLDRFAHQGVNGLWITVRLREVSSSSFLPRDPTIDRRVAKLRAVARKLRRYGIGLWVFAIEPHCIGAGDAHYDPKTDPLFKAHREWFRKNPHGETYVMCPHEPGVCQFLEESFADLFTRVPELAGYMNITHGERSTTCLSYAASDGSRAADPLSRLRQMCPTCAAAGPTRMHELLSGAMIRGIRRGNPSARMISWFYDPWRSARRPDWMFDIPRRLPEGVTLMFNFESGMQECQLGRMREGGDYWLSHVGPADSFVRMAKAGCRGAKLQIGNDFGLGTVPQVPAPALLYRKYKILHSLGCDTVLQNWLIGTTPGVQNAAAGELAFETFADTEDDFLRRLAAPRWGAARAERVASAFKAYSDAFAFYPLSMVSQYFSPFNEGVCWPLYPQIEMKPLTPSWKPDFPPCGDTVGEAFDNHTLREMLALVSRMTDLPDARAWPAASEGERIEIGLLRAVALHFRSARNILEFYWQRRRAYTLSRDRKDAAGAVAAVDRMRELVRAEEETSREMKALSTRDLRLGYHSEAEIYRYFPAAFDWRLRELAWADARLASIRSELAAGHPYPESARERTAETCVVNGPEIVTDGIVWKVTETEEGVCVSGRCPKRHPKVYVSFMNGTASEYPLAAVVSPDGLAEVPGSEAAPDRTMVRHEVAREGDAWTFSLTFSSWLWGRDPALRPAWLSFCVPYSNVRWAKPVGPARGRLRLGISPECYGRLLRK